MRKVGGRLIVNSRGVTIEAWSHVSKRVEAVRIGDELRFVSLQSDTATSTGLRGRHDGQDDTVEAVGASEVWSNG